MDGITVGEGLNQNNSLALLAEAAATVGPSVGQLETLAKVQGVQSDSDEQKPDTDSEPAYWPAYQPHQTSPTTKTEAVESTFCPSIASSIAPSNRTDLEVTCRVLGQSVSLISTATATGPTDQTINPPLIDLENEDDRKEASFTIGRSVGQPEYVQTDFQSSYAQVGSAQSTGYAQSANYAHSSSYYAQSYQSDQPAVSVNQPSHQPTYSAAPNSFPSYQQSVYYLQRSESLLSDKNHAQSTTAGLLTPGCICSLDRVGREKVIRELQVKNQRLEKTNSYLQTQNTQLLGGEHGALIRKLKEENLKLKEAVLSLQTSDIHLLRQQFQHSQKLVVENRQKQRLLSHENTQLKKQIKNLRETSHVAHSRYVCLGCVDRNDWQLIDDWATEIQNQLGPIIHAYHGLHNLSTIVNAKSKSRVLDANFHTCNLGEQPTQKESGPSPAKKARAHQPTKN